MVLVQSTSNDVSTNEVLDWVYYLAPASVVQRINDNAAIEHISIKINEKDNISIRTSGVNVDAGRIHSRWYRRGGLMFDPLPVAADSEQSYLMSAAFGKYIDREMGYILNSADDHLTPFKNTTNKFGDNDTNKISNLIVAAQTGLKVPDTLVTNDAQEVLSFVQRHQKVITKAIAYNDFSLHIDGAIAALTCTTTLVDLETVMQLAAKKTTSIPALYQQYTEKRYELRIFYLKGKFYAMAIFSQADEKTKIDFRNPDAGHQSRCVPYKLPLDIEEKLTQLMCRIGMNCGSIDMIVTPGREYVFLEVNPVGQFQWLSKNCNYDLERSIAHTLLQD